MPPAKKLFIAGGFFNFLINGLVKFLTIYLIHKMEMRGGCIREKIQATCPIIIN